MPFGEVVLRVIGAIVALGLVLLCAWLVLRWVGGKMPGVSGGTNRLIQVLDRVSVSRNSTIVLLRVQSKVFLVAISDNAVEKLCEMDDPDNTMALPKPAELPNFSVALKEAAKKLGKRGGSGGLGS